MADIKNKNELKRRINLFLDDFSTDEYKMNEEFCKETMRMMADYIGLTNQKIDQKDKQIINLKRQLKLQDNQITSHSEKDIVMECINLMKSTYDKMIEYLEYMDIDYKESEETLPIFHFSYFEIVQNLLLLHTSHSGGSSTRKKCHELGFDSYDSITFEPNDD